MLVNNRSYRCSALIENLLFANYRLCRGGVVIENYCLEIVDCVGVG